MSEETETQVGDVTCPRHHGEEVLGLGFEPWLCFQDMWIPGPGSKATLSGRVREVGTMG